MTVLSRSRHPNKEVEEAVSNAESKGWVFRKMGHWCRLFCVHADRDGCQVGINGTPRQPETHAKQIARAIERCPHVKEETDDDS